MNAAAVILGEVHLLHHVFLTLMFGIFVRLDDPRVRLSLLSEAARIGPGRDMTGPNVAMGKWVDGGYLPLVARITVGRGDFGEGTDAIVSRVIGSARPGLAKLRSPFGYIEAYAAGSCDCHCHCASAGVADADEAAMAATNSFDLVMVSLLPGGPHHRAADMERERSLQFGIPRPVITIRGRERDVAASRS